MRSPRTGLALKLLRWRRLANGVRPKLDELPHLREDHARLERRIAEAEELDRGLATHKAQVKDHQHRLDQVAADAEDDRMRLTAGLHAVYGARNARLIEYGVEPRRMRGKAKKKPSPKA